MAGWGGSFLRPEKIERVLASAGSTLGVRPTEVDILRVRHYCREALSAWRQVRQPRAGLARHSRSCPDVRRLAPEIGLATACVLHAVAGDPATYSCARAYLKALGLNLKERSSGRYKGRLKISKRGSGLARRWLYLAALRLIRRPSVWPWYVRKVQRDGGAKKPAVVAVMRKIGTGIQRSSAAGVAFDPQRLFPNCGCEKTPGPARSRR
jgi:transposase